MTTEGSRRMTSDIDQLIEGMSDVEVRRTCWSGAEVSEASVIRPRAMPWFIRTCVCKPAGAGAV